MENEPIKTVAGNWYSLTCTAAATVTAEIDGEPVTLATLAEGGTTVFCSPAATVTIATAGKYRVLPTKAPALNGNGGGTQPASSKVLPLPAESATELQDGRVYEPTDGLTDWNLSNVTVSPNATAEIRFTLPPDVAEGQPWGVTFPESWLWSDSDTWDATLDPPAVVGNFEAGVRYCVVVRNDNGTVIARVATKLKTA